MLPPPCHEPRQSNMELLRIVAMLLVMVVHADFRALSVPSVADFDSDTVRTVMRLVFESLSIICVNTFVLLSGWFGIHFKFSRLWEFLFQIAFFVVLFYGLAVVTRPDEALSLSGASNLLLLGQWDYWFVKCYLMLYIFSPVLNAFVEHATQRQFAIVLVLFYVFQTIYGLIGGAEWFQLGYSGISFMGLYLLARYVRLYPCRITTLRWSTDLAIYLVLAAVMTIIGVAVLAAGLDPRLINRLYAYTSPLVIVAALYFLLMFSKIKMPHIPIVNWIASSCFAIYLVHSNSWVGDAYYDSFIRQMFATYNGFPFLWRTSLFIIAVFCLSILLDKVRGALYSLLLRLRK